VAGLSWSNYGSTPYLLACSGEIVAIPHDVEEGRDPVMVRLAAAPIRGGCRSTWVPGVIWFTLNGYFSCSSCLRRAKAIRCALRYDNCAARLVFFFGRYSAVVDGDGGDRFPAAAFR